MKKCLYFILFVAVFCQAARFSKAKTDGFAMTKIGSDLVYDPKWDVSCNNLKEVKKILNQPFTYLSKGVQTYVFASEDGKYVLKLLRHDHMRPAPWVRLLPDRSAKPRIEKKQSKLNKDFTSYKIAYEELKDETGLVFLHLNKTDHLKQSLILIDKIGISHTLDLDQFEFLVQKRASLIYPTLSDLIEKGKIEEGKKALSTLVHLLEVRFEKQIFDKDSDLNTNFGFIENTAVQIDIGRFKKNHPERRHKKEVILHTTDHLHQWLMVRSPVLDEHLKAAIENL